MDLWLGSMETDPSNKAGIARVARHRPAELRDACWTAAGEKITEPQSSRERDAVTCCFRIMLTRGWPPELRLREMFSSVRLSQSTPGNYTNPLTADQVKRLEQIFPQGVCDYSRPGIAQQKVQETWRRY